MDWMAIAKMVIPAIITGIGGYWAHWKRTSEQRAEYEQLKKMRKLVGAGDVEKMQRADMLTELAIKQEKAGLTGEKWEEAKARILGKPIRRTRAETVDPATGEIGRYGGPVKYLPNGDKVETVHFTNSDGKEWDEDVLLRHNDNDLLAARDLYDALVFWRQAQNQMAFVAEGKDIAKIAAMRPNLEVVKERAKAVEDLYGREKLESELLKLDYIEFGRIQGKASALKWALGDNEHMDYEISAWAE